MKKPGWFQTDLGLAFLLVSLVVLLFVIYPFLAAGSTGKALVNVSFSLILLASAITVARPRTKRLLIALVFIAFATRWWSYVTFSPRAVLLDTVLTIVFLWLVIYLLLVRVFAKGVVNVHRIMGAVAVYMLIGLVFGLMHFVVEHVTPGAYLVNAELDSPERLMGHFSYFSFVTLTTVGYGDVTPLIPIAQQLAVLEGLIGQLFPAVLLARLVSMELAAKDRSNDARRGGGPE